MRVLPVVGTIALLLCLAIPSTAQTTGASVMSSLGESLRHHLSQYQIEGTRDHIRIIDRATGVEVLSVREVSATDVAITAVIGTWPGMSRDRRDQVKESIALFNYSSAVGTLWLDDRTGTVMMSHSLNPRSVPIQQLVKVATMCSQAAREQTQSLQ